MDRLAMPFVTTFCVSVTAASGAQLVRGAAWLSLVW
jgi:hypothetical protein